MVQGKGHYVSELKEGDDVQGLFAVKRKEGPRDYRQKKGKWFILELGDNTGSINLKYWGGEDEVTTVDIFRNISIGDVVFVSGAVSFDQYESGLVISSNEGVHVLRRFDGDVDPVDYIAGPRADGDKMMAEVDNGIASIGEPFLKALLTDLFKDEEFRREFMGSPSAVKHHHNYIGGQIEHTVGVLRICETLAGMYKDLDRDLLVAGALLHDVGKLRTYIYRTVIDRTPEGKFMGHTILGERMVRERIAKIDGFPEELSMKLSHMILRHMGAYGESGVRGGGSFGGIRTAEAAALHFADNADAQVKEFLQEVEEGRKVEKDWYYSNSLRSLIFLR